MSSLSVQYYVMSLANSTKVFKRAAVFSLAIACFFSSCKKQEGGDNSVVAGIDLGLVADNLVSPVLLVQAPDPSKSLYVVDQAGQIWRIDSSGKKGSSPFLDVTGKMIPLRPQYDERGLLGLAFHPDFQHNGKFYVFYSAPPHSGGPEPGAKWDNLVRVSEFSVFASNANFADPASEKVILEVDHPQFNHNGGMIAFGPDGFLYISIGDGGMADDNAPGHVADWYDVNAGGNAQNKEANLLGKILRIDVNGGAPYGIPTDNPYVGKAGLDEIYAFGFRNPYRFSFDLGGSHELFSQDAGQSLYEEIDIVAKGGNYGWNVKEGTHCFSTDDDKTERPSCPGIDPDGNPLINPVIELNNEANSNGGIATSIIGGNMYRGTAIPALDGKYIFGIFSGGGPTPDAKIFMSSPAGSGAWPFESVSINGKPDNLGMYIKGFGQDLSGEVYVLTTTEAGPSGNTGKVYKLIPGQ